jgi:tetratricopeptide (TPR) repeat protein
MAARPSIGPWRGRRATTRRLAWLAVAGLVIALSPAPGGAAAETPIDTARALLASYQEDGARLEQARDILAKAAKEDPRPATLTLLAKAWFLIGDVHARTDDERLDAYSQGRDAALRAIAAAPQSAEAHLYYAINLGRWAETKGLLRSALALSTVREEVDLVLRLDPRSVEGETLAGSLAAALPGFLGGSASGAEQHFRRALALDPQRAGVRVELAQLYVKEKRYADARRELDLALAEPTPSDLPYWTVRMLPRARALLASIRGKS